MLLNPFVTVAEQWNVWHGVWQFFMLTSGMNHAAGASIDDHQLTCLFSALVATTSMVPDVASG